MIAIVPYQPTWPTEFAGLAAALRQSLGALALRIDHIGSTSIPGLAAKDIIDIQITVAQLEAAIEEALSRIGYSRLTHINADHVPPGLPCATEQWSKWIFNHRAGHRPVNLHVRLDGRANQRYPLLFRDYLRTHPAAAQAYAQAKIALAHYHATDPGAYCMIKDPVCDIIICAAEDWAAQIDWNPAPSD